jgi:ABC-2 type transport system ATP-binding protein
MEIAEELCHRISIIRDGALIAGGTLDSLKDLAADGVENLEDLFLQLTGSFELQDVVAALRNG